MDRIIKYLILSALVLLMYDCKDEPLLFSQTPYTGSELRIDGYYYLQENEQTWIKFFYRNGIVLIFYHGFPTTDLTIVDEGIAEKYERCKNEKMCWGIFSVFGSTIQSTKWGHSVGGGLTSYKYMGTIENDTTFCLIRAIYYTGRIDEFNDCYHFRQFSPKPDSTNIFIE
jgi:hypothetical protein